MSQLLEVTLSECLEVKDAALNETDLWAILTQTLERIHALFYGGNITKLDELLPITPDSLVLCANGQTELTSTNKNSKFYEDCIPPEFFENVLFNAVEYEKMFIFSLGMCIYIAADYNLPSEKDLNISSEMDELLSSMCLKHSKNRINLNEALKMCSGNFMSITPILDLHRMVLGQTDIEMHPVEERDYDYSYETFKPDRLKSHAQLETIHYILLDRSPVTRSSVRSVEAFHDQTKAAETHKYEVSLLNDADIDETFSRLNNRRMKMESLRKGLKRIDNDDFSSARLSYYGPLNTNRSTLNSMATEDRRPLDFLSTEYEWLDKRAKEIDDWRKNYLKTKEVIITPDPIIRKTNATPQLETVQTMTNGRHSFPPEPPLDRKEHQNQSFVPLKGSMTNNFNADENYLKTYARVDAKVMNAEPEVQVGPEFRRSYPITNLMVREASLITEANIRHAKIRLLNGSEVDVVCCPSNTGQQLQECIAAFLLLEEPHLFGLAVPKEEELHFLNKELELRKVAPLDWSDKKKFRSRQSSFLLLYFCVQYFVPSLNYLRSRSTLHLFYLQLRQHLLSDRLQINFEDIPKNYEMAAMALQAEFGTFHEKAEFASQDYLPLRILTKSGEGVCRRNIVSKWRGMSVIPKEDAERIFVKECMDFKDYGYHFYKVSKMDNISSSTNTWIGVGLSGIVVGRNLEESRVLELLHQWGQTMKVSYNRHRFSISNNSYKYNYYTDSYRKCRYLLWLSSDQHSFILIPRIPSGDNFAGRLFDEGLLQNIGTVDRQHEQTRVKPEIEIPKLNISPPSDLDNDVELRTQNKILNYMQDKSQVNTQNFVEVSRDPANVTPLKAKQDEPTTKEYSLKPPTLKRNDQKLGQTKLNTQDKILKSLSQEPHIELPRFNFDEITTNKSNPDQLNVADLEMTTKPERLTSNQMNQRNKLFNDDKMTDEYFKGQDAKVSPPPGFKVSNNSSSLKPPVKAPRLFRNSVNSTEFTPKVMRADDINLPFMNNDQSGIQISKGVKFNPIFQDQIMVDKIENDKEVTTTPSETKNDEVTKIEPLHSKRGLNPENELNKAVEGDPNELIPSSSFTQKMASSQKAAPLNDHKPETSHERIKITLEKKPPGGYGIGLAKDRKHEGVFVISLLPGGVADMDGRLMPGDEIKSVNGEDVSGANGYSRVIELLSQNTATLEVERIDDKDSVIENPVQLSAVDGNVKDSKYGNIETKVPNILPRNISLSKISNASQSPKGFFRHIPQQRNLISQSSTNLNNNNNNNEELIGRSKLSEHINVSSRESYDNDVDGALPEDVFERNDKIDGNIKPSLSFDIQKIFKNLTDMMLLSSLEKKFVDLYNDDYKNELDKLIKNLEVQWSQDQPLIDFMSLTHPRRNDPCIEGSKQVNRLRNRYQNVLPFDNSRVILQSNPSNEYINASHIEYKVGGKPLTFIATQAPLPNTIDDFWLMVWKENVKFIAMLTRELENGQNKCCHYWPDHEPFTNDRFKIMLMGSHQMESFDVKMFLMVDLKSGEHRVVCHSSFEKWPQESLDDDETFKIIKFLSFMDQISKEGQVVVHCSAGIGRTGVLIATKICMEFIIRGMKFDLKSIIENLREQRGGFVQTRQQFQLCCKIVLDMLKFFNSFTKS